MTRNPGTMSKRKPISIWLAVIGLAPTVGLWLFPRTRTSVAVVLGLLFLCFLHPIWNFWFIEDYLPRRITLVLVWAVALTILGFHVPMDTPSNYVLLPPISMRPPTGTLAIGKERC